MNLTGPLKGYESAVSSGDIQYDEAQFNAVSHLQVLFDQLMRPPVEPGRLVSFFKRFHSPMLGCLFALPVGLIIDAFSSYPTTLHQQRCRVSFLRLAVLDQEEKKPDHRSHPKKIL